MIIGPAGKREAASKWHWTQRARALTANCYPPADTLYEGGFLRAELIFPPVSREQRRCSMWRIG